MTSLTTWLSAPSDLRIAAGRVDIWRAQLAVAPEILARLGAHLDQTERARAGRFVFERDANRFVAARGILRELVARYLERSPAELEFEYGPRGKPALRANSSAGLCLNVSHSHGMAAYAFACDRPLGIDIELIRPDFAGPEIADRYFSRSEAAELAALPAEVRAQAFFLCWTRKEAYIKALGEGLEIPLKSFGVSLTPGGVDELRSADASRWELHSFEPAPGYAGALVAEGKGFSIAYWDWAG